MKCVLSQNKAKKVLRWTGTMLLSCTDIRQKAVDELTSGFLSSIAALEQMSPYRLYLQADPY